MYYAGIDAHRSYLTVAIVDASGGLVRERKRVAIGDGEPLLEALEGLRPLEAVVETCPFWPWIHDTLEPTEIGFHLAHASKVEAIGKSDVKTDEIDARMLARLLSVGLVPEVYAKPEEQRDLVRKVRHRKQLVRDRTKWVNRIHGHLHAQGLEIGRERLLRAEGRKWLEEEAWPWLSGEQRRVVRSYLRLIDAVTEEVREVDKGIRAEAAKNPAALLLQTIPGIGPFRSLLLAAELTPISRFETPDKLASYAGLAPRTRSSGGVTRYGRTPGGANRWVRGELVSAIPTHVRLAPESPLTKHYERTKERIGWAKARVATARKLARVIHRMLETGEVWRESRPEESADGQGEARQACAAGSSDPDRPIN
jgi:transposase